MPLLLNGGHFIFRDQSERTYWLKRDKDIINNVLANPRPSFGLLGSDAVSEFSGEGAEQLLLDPVMSIKGLRFAVATLPNRLDRFKRKVAGEEPLALGTAYPITLKKELGDRALGAIVQGGAIESLPEQYPDLDGIFELVRSGDSLRRQGLEIVEDDIAPVKLMLARVAQYETEQ